MAAFGLAFLAGILSVFSPCVMPLLPLVLGAAASEHRFGPAALAAGLAISFVAIGLFVATVGFAIGLDGDVFRKVERWSERFAFAGALAPDERERMGRVMQFPVLKPGQVAYALDAPCPNYLMCIEGRTRIYKTSDAGREMLLYNVQDGGTCVLTTQCLLSRTNFPAESVAETTTSLAAIPARSFYEFMEDIPAFRTYVLADYTKLLGTMFSFVDSLAFQSIEQRLARRLLVEAGETLVVGKTHQQLASDIGSVREIVSRQLGEWERKGWISSSRGQVRIVDRAALASRRSA